MSSSGSVRPSESSELICRSRRPSSPCCPRRTIAARTPRSSPTPSRVDRRVREQLVPEPCRRPGRRAGSLSMPARSRSSSAVPTPGRSGIGSSNSSIERATGWASLSSRQRGGPPRSIAYSEADSAYTSAAADGGVPCRNSFRRRVRRGQHVQRERLSRVSRRAPPARSRPAPARRSGSAGCWPASRRGAARRARARRRARRRSSRRRRAPRSAASGARAIRSAYVPAHSSMIRYGWPSAVTPASKRSTTCGWPDICPAACASRRNRALVLLAVQRAVLDLDRDRPADRLLPGLVDRRVAAAGQHRSARSAGHGRHAASAAGCEASA